MAWLSKVKRTTRRLESIEVQYGTLLAATAGHSEWVTRSIRQSSEVDELPCLMGHTSG